jgi:SPX domain protein involved in polyphosphate accumulation
MQQQRYELKYRVSERTAVAVREFVRGYLVPDEFAALSADASYMVHSLYLDSPQLWLYRSTVNGDKNRFKLRLRFYDESADSPVFFEIKRRLDNCIMKQRAAVRRAAVPALLAGTWPSLCDLWRPEARPLAALQEFSRLMQRVRATPRSHVVYRREAWMSPRDTSARVTFDREVRCAPELRPQLRAAVPGAVQVFAQQVILELKFTARMPRWAAELVQCFGLVQSGAAKYVEGVTALGEHRVTSEPALVPLAGRPPAGPPWFAPRHRAPA